MVVVIYFLTDRFLNGKFLDYGYKAIIFFRYKPEEIRMEAELFGSIIKNPMCETFPRVASCDFWQFGSSGGQENINAICILGLNVINDKVSLKISSNS